MARASTKKTFNPRQFMNLPKLPPLRWTDPYPLWRRLSIETHSRCNRKCPFCPVGSGRRDVLGAGISMDDRLFDKIVAELDELGYDQNISPFLINEPLIDHKIIPRIKKLRAACPRANIYISTNGDALTKKYKMAVDRLKALYDAGVTVINLNVYDAAAAGRERRRQYSRYINAMERLNVARFTTNKYSMTRTKSIAVTDMRLERDSGDVSPTDRWMRRSAEARAEVTAPETYCARPHRHLVVRYDGKIPICCVVDQTHPDMISAGDVNKQTLVRVWNSETLRRYRYHLQDGKRSKLTACKTCDHRVAFPNIVRRIKARGRR